MKVFENIITENLEKPLSNYFKVKAKGIHYLGKASGGLKMNKAKNWLLSKRDLSHYRSQALQHNPSAENVEAALEIVKTDAAASVIAGIIISYSYIFYKKHISSAGRYCRGTIGNQKKACFRRFKIRSLEKRVEYLMSKKSLCNKSKDISKCKDRVDKKIEKLNRRIFVLQTIEERKQSKEYSR